MSIARTSYSNRVWNSMRNSCLEQFSHHISNYRTDIHKVICGLQNSEFSIWADKAVSVERERKHGLSSVWTLISYCCGLLQPMWLLCLNDPTVNFRYLIRMWSVVSSIETSTQWCDQHRRYRIYKWYEFEIVSTQRAIAMRWLWYSRMKRDALYVITHHICFVQYIHEQTT